MARRPAGEFLGKASIAVKFVIVRVEPHAFEPLLEIQNKIRDLIERGLFHLHVFGLKRRSHNVMNRLGMQQKAALSAKFCEGFEVLKITLPKTN